jgi:hypothetical protein
MIDRRIAIWYIGITMWMVLMATVLGHAESPSELLNSTENLSLPEAAFLLATHGYNVTYQDGIFLLNGSEIKQCGNTKMWEESRPT